ncbi:MAG: tyrosine-type recombinase/integrase, partial [Verrucomicrobiota bacterium]
KIYEVPTGRDGAWTAYALADYTSGKRRLRKFSDLKEAKTEAHRIAVNLANGETQAAAADFRDVAELVRCRELLAEVGDTATQTAVELFVEAARLVGPHRVVEAAREYLKRFPAGMEKVTLSKAVDEYHAALEARGRGPRHLADVKARLGRFLVDHPGKNLADVGTRTVQTWLDGLKSADGAPLSPLSKRNFAAVVSSFFDFHRRRGRISENPCADVERPVVRKTGDVEFWSGDEAAKLLAKIAPEARPALAVALFCGVRTAEICRLVRADFDFEHGHLAVGAGKAKTASRRLVPLPANLIAWLGKFASAEPTSPLWASGRADMLTRAVTAAAEDAEVRRVENGARHAFITYRVALTGDVPRVALESGNSPGVIHSNYRGLVRPDEAEKFFNIRPKVCDEAHSA